MSLCAALRRELVFLFSLPAVLSSSPVFGFFCHGAHGDTYKQPGRFLFRGKGGVGERGSILGTCVFTLAFFNLGEKGGRSLLFVSLFIFWWVRVEREGRGEEGEVM